MIATAIPHSSPPLKAADTNQRAELTPVVMADFTFAIAVSLASPIQPATSKTCHTAHVTQLISSELGAFGIFRCYPSSLASIDQERGVCHGLVGRPVIPNAAQADEHRSAIVLVMQRT